MPTRAGLLATHGVGRLWELAPYRGGGVTTKWGAAYVRRGMERAGSPEEGVTGFLVQGSGRGRDSELEGES